MSIDGKLCPFANEEGRLSLDFFHCVDGGQGSFDTDGYDRGAKDFAHDVALAAGQQGWRVTEDTITRPITGGNVGEDGVPFDGTVYVLTVATRRQPTDQVGAWAPTMRQGSFAPPHSAGSKEREQPNLAGWSEQIAALGRRPWTVR